MDYSKTFYTIFMDVLGCNNFGKYVVKYGPAGREVFDTLEAARSFETDLRKRGFVEFDLGA